MNAETRDVRSTVTRVASAVQQVASVGARFRPGICGQKIQTGCKAFLHLGLKSMVIAVSVCSGIAGITSKIRKRKPTLGGGETTAAGGAIEPGRICELRARRQNLRGIVGSWEHFQVSRQRGHIAGLDGQCRR